MSPVALRDRFVDTRGILQAAGVTAAWLGVSALLGELNPIDYGVAVLLFGGGILRSRTSTAKIAAAEKKKTGIYGPPS